MSGYCFPLRVCLSVCQCPLSNMNSILILFKFCIYIYIEWFGIVNGQNPLPFDSYWLCLPTKMFSSQYHENESMCSASILHKSIAGRHRPVSYPDGPISARYRFIRMLTGWLLAAGSFYVLSCSLFSSCVWWILSSIVITLLDKSGLVILLFVVCGIYTVCRDLFVLLLCHCQATVCDCSSS